MSIPAWRLSNRPLLDTRTDAGLFVGREQELDRLERAIALGLNVLVTGPSGVGKTSLLRQLARRRREAGGSQLAYLAGAVAETPHGLLEQVAAAVELRSAGDADRRGADRRDTDPLRQLDALARELQQRRQYDGALPVLVLDEPPSDTAYTMFGRLRDEVWQVPLGWIIAMDTADAATLLSPPADAFFEVRMELGHLSRAELAEMLRRRLADNPLTDNPLDNAPTDNALTDEVRAELAEFGEPRRVLDAARQLLTNEQSWPELKRAHREWDERLASLGRSARMAVMALSELGGSASASDPGLLDRLGWTRARAVQVLGELEDIGVLRSDQVPTGGSGRPRKVYRVCEPGAV